MITLKARAQVLALPAEGLKHDVDDSRRRFDWRCWNSSSTFGGLPEGAYHPFFVRSPPRRFALWTMDLIGMRAGCDGLLLHLLREPSWDELFSNRLCSHLLRTDLMATLDETLKTQRLEGSLDDLQYPRC